LFFGGFGAVVAAIALLAGRATASAVGGQAGSGLLQNGAYVWGVYFPAQFMFASIFPPERGYARRPGRTPFSPSRPGVRVPRVPLCAAGVPRRGPPAGGAAQARGAALSGAGVRLVRRGDAAVPVRPPGAVLARGLGIRRRHGDAAVRQHSPYDDAAAQTAAAR